MRVPGTGSRGCAAEPSRGRLADVTALRRAAPCSVSRQGCRQPANAVGSGGGVGSPPRARTGAAAGDGGRTAEAESCSGLDPGGARGSTSACHASRRTGGVRKARLTAAGAVEIARVVSSLRANAPRRTLERQQSAPLGRCAGHPHPPSRPSSGGAVSAAVRCGHRRISDHAVRRQAYVISTSTTATAFCPPLAMLDSGTAPPSKAKYELSARHATAVDTTSNRARCAKGPMRPSCPGRRTASGGERLIEMQSGEHRRPAEWPAAAAPSSRDIDRRWLLRTGWKPAGGSWPLGHRCAICLGSWTEIGHETLDIADGAHPSSSESCVLSATEFRRPSRSGPPAASALPLAASALRPAPSYVHASPDRLRSSLLTCCLSICSGYLPR